MDLQDKHSWCKKGEKLEFRFIELYGKDLSLKINPEKETNPYTYDLAPLADLKTQNTPFFMAGVKYNVDPNNAVVFNRKDAIRYYRLYPNTTIYFWVNWETTSFREYTVQPKQGVWKIPFSSLVELLKKAPLHRYKQRVNDNKGNAKESFILDISNPLFEKVI